MDQPINYAVLPWMDPMSAGRILPAVIGLLVLYSILEYFFKKHNTTMRRGTLALIRNTVWTLLLNLCIFTVAYWQWAFLLAAGMGALFIVILRHELKTAYQEELEGYRGLNPQIRAIRAELFSDLSIQEQLDYKKTVRPQKFYWWIWLPLVVILPFLCILLLEQLGVGDYLFEVVYYEV